MFLLYLFEINITGKVIKVVMVKVLSPLPPFKILVFIQLSVNKIAK